MNRLLLSATLAERGARRHTPAGLPALDLGLQHESLASEDGQPRKLRLTLRAVAIGGITAQLDKLPLGTALQLAGFIAAGRNGRGWVFHITEVLAESAVA